MRAALVWRRGKSTTEVDAVSYETKPSEAVDTLVKLREQLREYFSDLRGALRHGGELADGMSVQHLLGYRRAVGDVESKVEHAIRSALSDVVQP